MKIVFCTMTVLLFTAGFYVDAHGNTGGAISCVVLAVLWGVAFLLLPSGA